MLSIYNYIYVFYDVYTSYLNKYNLVAADYVVGFNLPYIL